MSFPTEGVHQSPTGIGGFDEVALGGLPAGRPTLVTGTTGSGKTVFAVEFLARGISEFGEAGVFVDFEETPTGIRENMASFGFEIAAWEAEGRWAFVDASPDAREQVVVGAFDLGALVARIAQAVRTVDAKRVVLDSLATIFARFPDPGLVRFELARLVIALKELGVTAVITAERDQEYGSIAGFGVEQFVADNVVILRNVVERGNRRRTLEILKFRGVPHRIGEFSFAIVPGEGISLLPIALIAEREHASLERVSVGNAELDRMLGEGVHRDAVVFVSGPTGTGKTLLATTFAAAGASVGQRSLLLSFEESREQMLRGAQSWGFDLEAMEGAGLLRVLGTYPEEASLENHFVTLRKLIDEFKPERVAIDNLSALQRVSTPRGLRDFIVGIASYLRRSEISSMFTSTTATLLGPDSVTEAHVSTLTDVVILLRYVEVAAAVRRAVCVLKIRASAHDTRIHEFTIDGEGMHVGPVFDGMGGILSGSVSPWSIAAEPSSSSRAGQ
ncbi:MAG TPA: circadian clock protein KaiC [Solirubrobacteraceae bacterium]|jgi:circadian clock protein KaiC